MILKRVLENVSSPSTGLIAFFFIYRHCSHIWAWTLRSRRSRWSRFGPQFFIDVGWSIDRISSGSTWSRWGRPWRFPIGRNFDVGVFFRGIFLNFGFFPRSSWRGCASFTGSSYAISLFVLWKKMFRKSSLFNAGILAFCLIDKLIRIL